ncbi:hypothetical protein ACJX0J_017559 [Zea mays]
MTALLDRFAWNDSENEHYNIGRLRDRKPYSALFNLNALADILIPVFTNIFGLDSQLSIKPGHVCSSGLFFLLFKRGGERSQWDMEGSMGTINKKHLAFLNYSYFKLYKYLALGFIVVDQRATCPPQILHLC